MKKILSLLVLLALVLSSVAASADFATATVVDKEEARNYSINPAGENEVDSEHSPTTGRPWTYYYTDEFLSKGYRGQYMSGTYYPILVQHCGINGGVLTGSPWYGSYADIYYELTKSNTGHTRYMMLFNDVIPPYAGASRSTRVGYVWIQKEWGAPYFFAGMQDSDGYVSTKYDTRVETAVQSLGYHPTQEKIPTEDRTFFNGLYGRPWTDPYARYRYQGYGAERNYIWDMYYQMDNILGTKRTFPNHAFKFTEEEPDAGDAADIVYLLWKKDQAVGDSASDPYYFNTMFQYEGDGVYSCYKIADMENPENGAIQFQEQVIDNISIEASGDKLHGDMSQGEYIDFANIIVQFVDDPLIQSYGECPYPILTGKGNAEVFVGGKHIKAVWVRNTYDDRTVFYGEDGEEISLMPGRTYIAVMDYKGSTREVRYE